MAKDNTKYFWRKNVRKSDRVFQSSPLTGVNLDPGTPVNLHPDSRSKFTSTFLWSSKVSDLHNWWIISRWRQNPIFPPAGCFRGALLIPTSIVSIPDFIFSSKRVWIPLSGVLPPNRGLGLRFYQFRRSDPKRFFGPRSAEKISVRATGWCFIVPIWCKIFR